MLWLLEIFKCKWYCKYCQLEWAKWVEKIPPAPKTNEIARFVEYWLLMNWEKKKNESFSDNLWTKQRRGWNLIIHVKCVLKRTVGGDWRLNILSGIHLQSPDSEDCLCSGWWNASHCRQSFSWLFSPRQSNSMHSSL